VSPRAPLATPQKLGSAELSRRLDRLYEAVTGRLTGARAGGQRPIWVAPAELVRLVQPYLGRN
jgi:hypothetical protein